MSSAQAQFEWFNINPPLANTPAQSAIAVLPLTTTSQNMDLSTIFGKLGAGHYLSVRPEFVGTGAQKAYIAFAGSSGILIPTLFQLGTGVNGTGVGTGLCYHIPDGVEMRFRSPPGLRQVGTALPTGIATFVSHNILQFMGSATGFLRIYRSSMASHDESPFPMPSPLLP